MRGVARLRNYFDALRPPTVDIEPLRTEIGHRAPALWNDTGVAALDPHIRACDLPATDAELERSLSWDVTAQQQMLRSVGFDALREALARDELSIPPPAARERYFEADDLAYWLFGYGDLLLLREAAELDGARVLDFGSSSGRVLRHLHVHEPNASLVGVDIGVQAIQWSREHLPFPIVQGTVIPTLPLADASIDVIFAGSVFTHIDHFEEAWLCELRRVLRPDGVALMSFHPARIWEQLRDPSHFMRRMFDSVPHVMHPPGGPPDFSSEQPPAERVVFTCTTWPVNNTNVIHSREYVREHWGRIFDVQGFIERAHGNQQDMAILR
jgi:SAM-dependent methyltransferase